MKTKPKYNLGQIVFFMEDNKVVGKAITAIVYLKKEKVFMYGVGEYGVGQPVYLSSNIFEAHDIFPTKEALLETL